MTPIKIKRGLGWRLPKSEFLGAVARNTIKRIIKEQFRHKHAELPALDIVFILKQSTKDLTNDQMRQQIDEILAKVMAKHRRTMTSKAQ